MPVLIVHPIARAATFAPVRLAVLDIGSNTGHLLVVDPHRGAAPLPASSIKQPLRLSEHIDSSGALDDTGVRDLLQFVEQAHELATDKGCESILAFATSAIRDATNGDETLAKVSERTGLDLQVLGGDDALVFDIGGGSLEIAAGADEHPDVAQSLPLGAARLTPRCPGSRPTAPIRWSRARWSPMP